MSGAKVAGLAAAGVVSLPVLVVLAISGTSPTPPPVPGGGLNTGKVPGAYVQLVQSAGSLCPGITAPAIAAQLDAESGWNPNASSPVGAQGIAQFMPGTWTTWGKDYNSNGTNSPLDPGDAIPAQGHFMCALYAQVSSLLTKKQVSGNALDLAWAAYNAGLGNVIAAGGIPPITETQNYVRRIRLLMAAYTAAGGGGSFPAPSGPFQTRVVQLARSQLGVPYVFGGGNYAGPSNGGFDCSGFTQFVIYQATTPHLMTPRTAAADHAFSVLGVVAQYSGSGSRDAALSKMVAGDVITFNVPTDPAPWGHVGIYIGGGQMIDAPHPGAPVHVADLRTDYAYQWTAARVPPLYTGGVNLTAPATSSPAAAAAPREVGTPPSAGPVGIEQRKAWS